MPAATAAELHRRALAESASGRHGTARRLLRTALRRQPDRVQRARILVSLSYHEAEQRDLAAGLELLDEAGAVPDLPATIRGLIAGQRGMLYKRAGEAAAAAAWFDAALGLLTERDPIEICRVLLNRGTLRLWHGTPAAARADFNRLLGITTRHGIQIMAAKAHYNLAYLSLIEGDLPRALREMDAPNRLLAGESPGFAGVYHLDRAQALIAAGLFREADEDLVQAIDLFRKARMPQDRATAELTWAKLAMLQERWADARTRARSSQRRFARRGAQTWALLAASVAVAANLAGGHRSRSVAQLAIDLADRLSAAGLVEEGRRARLAAATARLAAGDLNGAGDLARTCALLRRDEPLVTRLHARRLRAELADAAGHGKRATAELRAAMLDLHRYQASFGSIDLQTSVTGHGRRLAEWGLRRALTAGRPAEIFNWAERVRALSARLPRVTPPNDPELAHLLAELRRARAGRQTQLLTGRGDPASAARCLHLERLIRQRSWYRPGPGQTSSPAPLGRLRDELRGPDATFVAHLLCDGRLHALIATARRAAVRDIGPAAPTVEQVRRLRADLDALATATLPLAVRATIEMSCRTILAALDDVLLASLQGLATGGPLLLAPAGMLAGTPWTLLPSMHDRPLTVVSSVTAWLATRAEAVLPSRPSILAAAGPRLLRANDEVKLVASAWGAGAALTGPAAQCAAVRAGAATVDVLHLAAHGVHEPENPLFSSVELADGPLFGYELEQLPQLPRHVMLSACALGLARTRPGDEVLGMTAALLHGGCGSVVAAVANVDDDVACRVAMAHHAALSRGLPPAVALASALSRTEGQPAPLVCFGAGW